MTRRSRRQRLLLLSASTVLVVGGAAPAGTAFAAPATPHVGAATTMPAGYGGHERHGTSVPAVEWVETKDPPSGITAEFPGKATVQESSIPVEGKTVNGRYYRVDITKDEGVGLAVFDMPGDQYSLDENLQGFLDGYSIVTGGETLTSTNVRKTTVDGHPVLDARLSAEEGEGAVGFLRLIADDDHLVHAVTFGPAANEKALKEMHERFLAGIRIP